GYLRGAVMKIGQTLANFPDIVPQAFVETLERLHYDAPPMHWSLMRELVHNELGDDPENVFASFDQRAFAAASLGQVHAARVLTMDFLDGVHLDAFVARGPSQAERDAIARKFVRAWYRMLYAGRMSHADLHPGNFLVMDDGRLGVIDFGFVVAHGDEDWKI